MPVVAVSNHEEMLKAMHRSKKAQEQLDAFDKVCLVYLRKGKGVLEQHLRLPIGSGAIRQLQDVAYTLKHYERFDRMFRELADEIIECDNHTISEAVSQIRKLTSP